MGDVLKTIGNVAPFAASLIPGIGPIAGAAIGAGSKLLSGGGAKGALEGGLEGAGSAAIGGQKGLLPSLKGAFGTSSADGSGWTPDIAKILSGVGGVAGALGNAQQRKSAQTYNNAEIGQRNALMSNILSPKNYGFQPNANPNLNAQANTSSAPGY